MQSVLALEIQTIEPSPQLLTKAIDWAIRINQTAAYDGVFLAVAESLQAELWTADRRLAEAAHALGINWVHYLL